MIDVNKLLKFRGTTPHSVLPAWSRMYWQLFKRVGVLRCTLFNSTQIFTMNTSSVWIHLLLMVAHLPPSPKHSALLELKWSHFLSRHGILCAICWVKHTGPLLECRDSACLERNKSLLAVAWVALWHYSLRRGMVLMLTNTGEQGSFTTHPLSAVPILHRLQGHFSPSQGYICIQVPKIELYGCWFCLIHTYY